MQAIFDLVMNNYYETELDQLISQTIGRNIKLKKVKWQLLEKRIKKRYNSEQGNHNGTAWDSTESVVRMILPFDPPEWAMTSLWDSAAWLKGKAWSTMGLSHPHS